MVSEERSREEMSGECPVCSEHTLECKCHIVDYIHWAMTRCKPDSRPCESFEAMAYLMLKWIAYLDAEKKEIQRLRSEWSLIAHNARKK